MASIVDLFIDQGSDFDIDLDIQDDHGQSINLTDCVMFSVMKKDPKSVNSYAIDCNVVDNPQFGKIRLSLPGINSTLIPYGRYMYDVIIINTVTNKKTRAVEGIVTLDPELTII